MHWGRLIAVVLAFFVVLGLIGIANSQTPPGPLAPRATRLEQLARARMGRELFSDPIMSVDGRMTCAKCHDPSPAFGYSDGRKKAIGRIGSANTGRGLIGIRRTKSLINCGDLVTEPSNWDGRADGIRASCLQAVTDPLVMGYASIDACLARINAQPRYRELTRAAFSQNTLLEAGLRTVLVAYLQTIRSDDTPAHRLHRGEPVILPAAVGRGYQLFLEHCAVCHDPDNGWRGHEFVRSGLAVRSRSRDTLRGAITGRPADNFKTTTPTLVDVARHPPYAFNGSLEDLETAVNYFAHGGRYRLAGDIVRDPEIDPRIAAIDLDHSQEADLLAFIRLGLQSETPP